MEDRYDIWIIHSRREVQLSDAPGPPDAVIASSDGTVGGTLFPADCWIQAPFEFQDARRIAEIAAEVRGYTVDVALMSDDLDEIDAELDEVDMDWGPL